MKMAPNKYYPRVKCTHPHYCYDWDSLFITPLNDEFQCCTCYCDGGPISTNLKDWTSLDDLERKEFKRWIDHEEKKQKEELQPAADA